MSLQNKSQVKWNWATAKVTYPSGPSAEQIWYQERYGDELTLAVKVAKKNLRREQFREVYRAFLEA